MRSAWGSEIESREREYNLELAPWESRTFSRVCAAAEARISFVIEPRAVQRVETRFDGVHGYSMPTYDTPDDT